MNKDLNRYLCMEILRMNYKFTLTLFLMLFLLAVFGGPAYPKGDKFLKISPKNFILPEPQLEIND